MHLRITHLHSYLHTRRDLCLVGVAAGPSSEHAGNAPGPGSGATLESSVSRGPGSCGALLARMGERAERKSEGKFVYRTLSKRDFVSCTLHSLN